MQYRKYEFSNPQEWNTLKNTLELDSNKYPINCSIVEYGNLILIHGNADSEGNLLTPHTYSNKYAVDILWAEDTIPSTFTQYEVWPRPASCRYMFLGMGGLYQEGYDKRNQ